MRISRISAALNICLLIIFLSSCASSSRLEEGQMEVKRVFVTADDESVDTKTLRNYVHQLPGMRGGKKQHHVYDSLKTAMSCRDLTTAMQNRGFLHATVKASVQELHKAVAKGKGKGKPATCAVTYDIHAGEPYTLRRVNFDIQDHRLDSLMRNEFGYGTRYHQLSMSKLQSGSRFSVANLNEERSMITQMLQSRGYYKFNKEFIRFVADTVAGEKSVDLTLVLTPFRANNLSPETEHPCYIIRDIVYQSTTTDNIPLRQSVLDENTALTVGKPYSAADVQNTYRRFGRLKALRFTNIRFTEVPDTTLLDCAVQISPAKPNSISFQPEGTNTAGDLGAAVALTYENRNLFRGSETFSLQLRGAYESITGLEGYQNEDYVEYGVEGKLQFPRFLAPFISRSFRHDVISTSELSVAYNLQNRPEFHRRMFSAAWRYRWTMGKVQYKIDLPDLNYIYMPWISATFKEDYLDSEDNRNAILRYNYEDLFIMKLGFGFTYSGNNNALRFNIETAGNLLNALSTLSLFSKNSNNQYTLFNIAYAQYVKADIDATRLFRLSPRSELALHGALGIACPYSNSSVLPFEKRYFSGGANSVRGWSVRGLGPGGYSGTDGRIDFINQTGDIKIDLNLEYRFFMFWKLNGAAFVDAGNIWTIKEYENQPGGQFRVDRFMSQMAVAYGLGLRFNLDYFILRFDMGMKAVNPVHNNSREHYPLLHPDLSRDFAFHFAVGLPF